MSGQLVNVYSYIAIVWGGEKCILLLCVCVCVCGSWLSQIQLHSYNNYVLLHSYSIAITRIMKFY